MKCPNCGRLLNQKHMCPYCGYRKKIFLRIKRDILALFFAVLALISLSSQIASAICSVISLVFVISTIKNPQYYKANAIIITILSSLISIVCLAFFISVTFFPPPNVVAGNWGKLPTGGYYIFNKDYTYYQSIDGSDNDNYCTGKYEFKTGFVNPDNEKDKKIKDHDYSYYTLTLIANECIIEGQTKNFESVLNEDRQLMLAIGINNPNQGILLNVSTKIFHHVTRE